MHGFTYNRQINEILLKSGDGPKIDPIEITEEIREFWVSSGLVGDARIPENDHLIILLEHERRVLKIEMENEREKHDSRP